MSKSQFQTISNKRVVKDLPKVKLLNHLKKYNSEEKLEVQAVVSIKRVKGG